MTDQATHAELFGATSKQLMQAAVAFGREVEGVFTPEDVAKLFFTTALALTLPQLGDAGTAAYLRQLAAGLEAEKPLAN